MFDNTLPILSNYNVTICYFLHPTPSLRYIPLSSSSQCYNYADLLIGIEAGREVHYDHSCFLLLRRGTILSNTALIARRPSIRKPSGGTKSTEVASATRRGLTYKNILYSRRAASTKVYLDRNIRCAMIDGPDSRSETRTAKRLPPSRRETSIQHLERLIAHRDTRTSHTLGEF